MGGDTQFAKIPIVLARVLARARPFARAISNFFIAKKCSSVKLGRCIGFRFFFFVDFFVFRRGKQWRRRKHA